MHISCLVMSNLTWLGKYKDQCIGFEQNLSTCLNNRNAKLRIYLRIDFVFPKSPNKDVILR